MTEPPRRWTLYDTSDDYNPKWVIGDGTPPPALEHLESVIVMPVKEHELEIADMSRRIENDLKRALRRSNEIASLRQAASDALASWDRYNNGAKVKRAPVTAMENLREVLSG